MKNTILLTIVLLSGIALSQSSSSWTELNTPSQPSTRSYAMISGTSDNDVLLFGGFDGAVDGETWIFDNSSRSWTQLNPPSQPSARQIAMMAQISENEVLLFGGYDTGFLNDTWIFDNSSGSWTELVPPNPPGPRTDSKMARISDNKVLLFGGYDENDDFIGETWIFDNSSRSWTELIPPNPPSPRAFHAISYLSDNKVLLFAGEDAGDILNETWIFDNSSGSWSELATPVSPTATTDPMIAQFSDNKVLLFGGIDTGGDRNNETWIFDNGSGSWTQLNTTIQPSERDAAMMAQISNGLILLFGGDIGNGNNENDTWLFGPVESIAPIINNLTAVSISPESASFYMNLADGGATTTYTFDYGTATGLYSLNYSNTIAGNYVTVNVGFEDDNNLTANTQYYVQASATNTIGRTESNEINFWTLIAEPASHSNFSQVGKDVNQIELSFDAFSGLTNVSGYLILRSVSSFGENDLPSDGNAYEVNDNIGNSTVVAKIIVNSTTNYTFTGLSRDQSWQYALVPFNLGANVATTNYKTDNVPTITGFTIPTLGEWGMIAFAGLMLIGGVWYSRRI
ncbi:IPTL-CTERM sorting domain-containing protein [Candidatus Kapabacteria bacterium]|nr:IPTL-CTERM sorting domain-containing protein [Candidatus Kapabacteria bacterium]